MGLLGGMSAWIPGYPKTYPQPGTNERFLMIFGGFSCIVWDMFSQFSCRFFFQYLITDQIRKFVTHLDFRMTRMFCVCRPANNWKVEELLKTPRQLRLWADLEVFVVLKIEKNKRSKQVVQSTVLCRFVSL